MDLMIGQKHRRNAVFRKRVKKPIYIRDFRFHFYDRLEKKRSLKTQLLPDFCVHYSSECKKMLDAGEFTRRPKGCVKV